MLLDNNYTIIPSIRFSLTYDNGVRTVITVKTRDKIDCTYKKNGERFHIVGIVAKIGCNFNSSLGTVGTTAYMQVDGSCECAGQVEYIQPEQILDISIISTSGSIENIVCSVDNDDQRISLIRENEVGVMQYSLDGITWRAVNGAQGMSAYECAVKLGFDGTEEEWLASLQGKDGKPGKPGALDIFKVYDTKDESRVDKNCVPDGKLIVVVNADIPGEKSQLFVRDSTHISSSDNCGCSCGCDCSCHHHDDDIISGYKYLGYLTVGPHGKEGKPGKPGKSAYETAVDNGYPGTEEEFNKQLASGNATATNSYIGQAPHFENTVIGPIDLKIYGYTDSTFRSKRISRIDISSTTDPDNQTIIFPDDIVLRAIPTEHASAKPNIEINGRKYVADCIMARNGEVGVLRRVRLIDSYADEPIVGDWISSTGELDMGARVQYVIPGEFEAFDPDVQDQYRKLHAYNKDTNIAVTDKNTYVSVEYPINLEQFIKDTSGGAVFEEEFTTTYGIGGVPTGTVIKKGDSVATILKMILCPDGEPVPPGPGPNPPGPDPEPPKPVNKNMYYGVSTDIPKDFTGLTKEAVADEAKIVAEGIVKGYTSNNEYLVLAIKQSLGKIRSIKDYMGFENIDGWTFAEFTDPESTDSYYIYYTKEPLTIEDEFMLQFKFKVF